MIFISHNHADKPVVGQLANRLADIFGQEKIFYDSWSIQPGDGIVGRMNEGLENCKIFLFFVSKKSLQSKMVELEWQNAIIKATKGHTKIIPVKLDDCMMPAILLQTLYIDLFSQGLEVATRQIIDVVTGKNTYTGPQEFSNLRCYIYKEKEKCIVEIRAIHFMEPISKYALVHNHEHTDVDFSLGHAFMLQSNTGHLRNNDTGEIFNVLVVSNDRATAPGYPFIIELTTKSHTSLQILEVAHQGPNDTWKPIPTAFQRPYD
ncbi:Hypothetical protein HVPorG_04854 [Roseomonas mucosa]|uniref:toll/interleukin-1 receptor domain-containing protein n=1 Tax=Roseomonas mucosa TaxID=207340 RepID=UPI00220FC81D|nr:toll/interleukin-1 receptor domain-containing protein [Roseomonas mucosa]QDJ07675.1 Hypothetical protein HVPorG_04854 [Roseomonas mucosa]